MTVKDILSKLTVDNLAGMKIILYDMNKWMPDGVEYDPLQNYGKIAEKTIALAMWSGTNYFVYSRKFLGLAQ